MPMLTSRNDLTAEKLRRLALREINARLAANANALDGMSRAMAAKLAGHVPAVGRRWKRDPARFRPSR